MKEGSYRVNDIGIVLPCDTRVLLNSHCLVFKVADPVNQYNITWPYLAYLLSHPFVEKQVRFHVFIDTTLPNIGDRWRKLLLPVTQDVDEIDRITNQVLSVCERRIEAETVLLQLKQNSDKS